MPTETQRIHHELNNQVADIRKGCTLSTAKGELFFNGREADELATFVQAMYENKLRQCVQLDGCVSCEE